MVAIRVQITRWLSDEFPGFVECRFTDAEGVEHVVHEKVPVVTRDDVSKATAFPVEGAIACEVSGSRFEDGGRMLSVTTVRPWNVETTVGVSRFDVRPGQLMVLGAGNRTSNRDPLVVDHVERFGWHVVKVHGDSVGPPFAYTIGLYESFGQPEAIVFGLNDDLEAMHWLLNQVGPAVRDGRVLSQASSHDDFLPGHACVCLEVGADRYDEFVGQALRHYGGAEFPLVQLVWPSPQGAYPWDASLDEVNARRQPLIGSR